MVLIVEDEAISRRALLRLLRMNGYKSCAVGSAEEAHRFITEGNVPEVALLDIDLPGMSGIDFARWLGRTNPSVVSVFLTANDEQQVSDLFSGQPPYFFRKPVDINGLLGIMERLPTLKALREQGRAEYSGQPG